MKEKAPDGRLILFHQCIKGPFVAKYNNLCYQRYVVELAHCLFVSVVLLPLHFYAAHLDVSGTILVFMHLDERFVWRFDIGSSFTCNICDYNLSHPNTEYQKADSSNSSFFGQYPKEYS